MIKTDCENEKRKQKKKKKEKKKEKKKKGNFLIKTTVPIYGMRDLHVKLKLDKRDDEPPELTRPCGKVRCKTFKRIIPTQIAKSASGAIIKR